MTDSNQGYEGGCTCGHVRYKVNSAPMIVQSCHCSRCQRQSGSAFATNAVVEADRVTLLAGEVAEFEVETPSGNGQTIARCPKCMVAVWGNYFSGGVKEKLRFIRVGSLDNPGLCPPDIHVFTSTKQPWVDIPAGVPAVSAFYDLGDIWSGDSIKRRAAVFEAAGISMP